MGGWLMTGDPLGRVRNRTIGWRVAGLLAGVAAALALLGAPARLLGLGSALAAPAFALVLLVGVIVGELSGRPPTGVTRTATIEVRSAAAFLPRGLLRWVAVTGAVLALFLAVTTLTGSADDLGRAGRALSVACSPEVGSTVTPWPGSFYAGPIAATVLIGLLLAALASRAVARRPRPRPDEPARLADDQLRRASGRAITAAVGVLVAAPLAGIGAVRRGRAQYRRLWRDAHADRGPGRLRARRGRARGVGGLRGRAAAPGRAPVAVTSPTSPQIVVDTASPTPPFEQIRAQLAALIRRGELAPDQRLPPVRQLAADLGLAVGTVARAYRELELTGQVTSRRGGGTRVAPVAARSAATCPTNGSPSTRRRTSRLPAGSAPPTTPCSRPSGTQVAAIQDPQRPLGCRHA